MAKQKKGDKPVTTEEAVVASRTNGGIARVLSRDDVQENIQGYVSWLEAQGGPKVKPALAQVLVHGYKYYQTSDAAKDRRASRADQKKQDADAKAQRSEEKAAAKKEREEKAAARKTTAKKTAKPPTKAAAASKPPTKKTTAKRTTTVKKSAKQNADAPY